MRRIGIAALSLAFCGRVLAADLQQVAVTAIVEHPALDAVRSGVAEGLGKAGYKDGQTIRLTFQSAQGSQGTAVQIARGLAAENPAVIVAISTPSAQSVAAATRSVPIVFSAVTDPVAARLVASPERPGGNVTGVSDMAPVAEQLALLKRIAPRVDRLGVIYNAGEANSTAVLRVIQDQAKRLGLTVVEATVGKSADVQSAARGLVGRVDAVYVPTDNTVVSALEAVVAVCQKNRLPLISGDAESVGRGALASIGLDYHNVGLDTATIVVRILKGEKPGDIPVLNAVGTELVINKGAAAKTGIVVPPDVLAKAGKVFD